MKCQQNETPCQNRDGVAAVEFAVCLPMIVVLIIGVIECCSMIYLKQSLSVAAYEGIRASTLPRATDEDVRDACERILTSRGISNPQVTITPADFQSQPAQSWIRVNITAPGGSNSVVAGWFYEDLIVEANGSMMKEF